MNLKTRVSIFLASACMASSLAYVLSHHKLSATAAARLRPTPTDSDAVLKPGRSTSPRSVQSSPGALATCPEHRILRANKTKSHKGSTNSTKHRRYLEISGDIWRYLDMAKWQLQVLPSTLTRIGNSLTFCPHAWTGWPGLPLRHSRRVV